MATTPPQPDSNLREAQDRFVEVWGQMAGAWGISRTMAQVHALLYITGEPLCSDDVMDRLQISRGNASMSLRALLDWGIIERVHRRGDRKEYFKAEQDVWAMFRAIVRERTKREVDPLLASLYEIRDIAGQPTAGGAGASKTPSRALSDHQQRVDDLVAFFQTVEKVSRAFVSPAGRGLQSAASLLTHMDDVSAAMGEDEDRAKPDAERDARRESESGD
jgi:DNA-binding transcriptional regulator GbsR (MarR family)